MTSQERTHEIQSFILNNKNLSNEEIAIALNVTRQVLAGNIVALKRRKIFDIEFLPALPVKEKTKLVEEVYKYGDFTNHNGECKEEARDRIVKAIALSLLKSGMILSLCADEFRIESKIFKKVTPKYTYFCVEHNEKVYRKATKNLTKLALNANLYNGEIGYVIERAKENDFSHAVLDYCGQLSTFHTDIINTIQKNIVCVGGKIFITLNLRANVFHMAFYENILKEANIDKKDIEPNKYVLTAINEFLKKLCGFNYSCDDIFQYRDKKDNGKKLGANMVLITLTRLK